MSYLWNGLCFTFYGGMFLFFFFGKAVGTVQKRKKRKRKTSKAVGTSENK